MIYLVIALLDLCTKNKVDNYQSCAYTGKPQEKSIEILRISN